MTNIDLRMRVLLSIQGSMLGLITPNIRGITCKWNEAQIWLRAIFDGEISDDDEEHMSELLTELVSQLPAHNSDIELVRNDFPEAMGPFFLDEWVYRRYETIEG